MCKLFEKNKKVGYLFIIAVSFALLCCCILLFYRQAIKFNGMYPSDLTAHINNALNRKSYSLIAIIIKCLYGIFGSVFAVAVFEGLMVVCTWLLTGKLIQNRIQDGEYIKSCILALPLIFLTGIYIPWFYEFFYSGQMATQPWHNITYFGMRLFAVCVMIIFDKMLKHYLGKIDLLQWGCLTLFLTFTTAVKPNFLLGYAVALALFLLTDLLRKPIDRKSFFHIFMMGLTIVPSLVVLFFQARLLYGSSPEEGGSGIEVIWGSNLLQNGITSLVLKLVCSLAFPCLVFLKNRKDLKRFDRFTGIMFLIQFFIVEMFQETGSRAGHGNFGWGRRCAMYLLFVSAISMFYRNWHTDEKKNRCYKVCGVLLLCLQVLSGATYFVRVLMGYSYLV